MYTGGGKFEFSGFKVEDVRKEILGLRNDKKGSGPFPTKILKLAVDEYVYALTDCFNEALNSNSFPDELKMADIIPIHKKGPTTDKCNYRPISLLPTLSKVFERLIAKQVGSYMEPHLSKFLCGFRKGYSSQHALLSMLRNWQNCLNKSGKVGALLMDLSKAFDCLPHDLLIAKLEAYGFGIKSVRFLFSYLRHRKQRVKISSILSEWLEVLAGVPQGSVLGPILFNIFINDIFFSVHSSSICNFADDNTLFVCDETLDEVLRRLNLDIGNIVNWFNHNAMVANPDKFQLFIPRHQSNSLSVKVASVTILNSEVVKLLGVYIDAKLCFNSHVREMCKRVSQKTRALARIRCFLNQGKADVLFNSFILSHFNYCPLIWMFCDKSSHQLINTTHRRALSVKHNNFSLRDCNFLSHLNLNSLHQRNLLYLVTEVYKSLHCIGPSLMWSNFQVNSHSYSLRRGINVKIPRVYNNLGLNSFDVRSAQAWNHLSDHVKSASTVNEFNRLASKSNIYCRCTLCC